MITVTECAAAGLYRLLEYHEAPHGQGVKLRACCKGGIGMTIDKPGEGDKVIWRHGRPLLVIDRGVVEFLEGTVLHCESMEIGGQRGMRFHLQSAGRRG